MRAGPSVVPPEECPEPSWHETHRYCPCCSWTEERPPPSGAELIAAERQRQVQVEGHSPDHDRGHTDGELLNAAWCYLTGILDFQTDPAHGVREPWPWDEDDWKPTPADPVRQLVKAGALIAAEIDRLQATP